MGYFNDYGISKFFWDIFRHLGLLPWLFRWFPLGFLPGPFTDYSRDSIRDSSRISPGFSLRISSVLSFGISSGIPSLIEEFIKRFVLRILHLFRLGWTFSSIFLLASFNVFFSIFLGIPLGILPRFLTGFHYVVHQNFSNLCLFTVKDSYRDQHLRFLPDVLREFFRGMLHWFMQDFLH